MERIKVPIDYGLSDDIITNIKGYCGEDCTYIFDHETKELEINGGKMTDRNDVTEVPWYSQMKNIKSIVIWIL